MAKSRQRKAPQPGKHESGTHDAQTRRAGIAVLTPAEKTIAWAVAAFVLIRWVATLLGGGTVRLWGIDYASYVMPSWDVIAALSLPLLMLVPPVRTWCAHLLARDTPGSGGMRALAALAVTAAAVAAVWKWEVAYAFLGDGAYYATEIFRIIANAQYATALIKPTSWLTGHLIHWATVTWQPESVRWPFQAIGVAGMLVLAAGSMLLTMRARLAETVLLVTAALLGSASLMYFGYIELYALEFAFSVLFLISAYQVLQYRGTVVVPGVMLAAAVACGASAVIFVPAYLLVLHWKFRGEHGAFPLARAAAILCALPFAGAAALYAYIGAATYNPYLLSILPARLVEFGIVQGVQQYTVFSAAHLADIVNVLLLNGGAFILVLPVALIVLRREIRWSDPAVLLALVVVSASVVLLVAGNTTLGLARDWDLMTVPAAGIVFAAAFVLLRAQASRTVSLTLVVPLLVLTAFGGTYAWLRVNFDGDASALRLEHALTRDAGKVLPINTYTGLENLRKYYHSTKDQARMLSALHRMAETGVQKIDTYTKLTTVISEMKDASERTREYTWLFGRLYDEVIHPSARDARSYIDPRVLRENAAKVLLYGVQTGDAALTTEWVGKMRTVIPDWKEVHLIDAYLTPGITPAQMAAHARESIDEHTQDAALLLGAARLHNQAQEYEKAAEYYELSHRRDPKLVPVTYLELAQIYVEKLQRIDDGIAALQKCIAEAPSSNEAAQARDILGKLEQMRAQGAR